MLLCPADDRKVALRGGSLLVEAVHAGRGKVLRIPSTRLRSAFFWYQQDPG